MNEGVKKIYGAFLTPESTFKHNFCRSGECKKIENNEKNGGLDKERSLSARIVEALNS